MSSMDPHDDGQSYLAAFRAERPGPGARRRNWAVLQQRLDEPAASGAMMGFAARRRMALSIGASLAIAAAVLLMLRGLGGGIVAMQERRTPAMEAVDQAVPAAPQVATPARGLAPSGGTAIEAAPAAVPEAPSARTPSPQTPAVAPSPASVPLQAPTPATPAEPSTVNPDDLAAETLLLAEARRALSEGRPEVALEVLERHAQRFPEGTLQEERRAYQAIARCDGSPSTQTAAQFLTRYPSSPHGARVRTACGSPP